MKRLPRRVCVPALVLALAGTVGGAVSGQPREVAAAPAAGCATAAAAGYQAAQRLARACATPVEVIDRRTEHNQVMAEPNGSFTLTASVQPRWVRRSGSWAPLDPTLRRRPDGSLAPVAVTVPVVLSGGGSGPLVQASTAGGDWSLSWPGQLAPPRVDGAVAVYPGVRAGVDLRITVLPAGFSYLFVIHTLEALRAAAADPLTLQVNGPRLRGRDGGGAEVLADDGRLLLAIGAASMWDSRGGVFADGPGDTARMAPVGMRTDGRGLSLVPDEAMTADPGLTFPIFLDPQISAPRPRWAYANTDNGSYDNIGGVARVGRNPECCGGTWRGFFEFSIGEVAGKRVKAANFNSQITHSWNCTSRGVRLWRSDAIPGGVGNGGRSAWSPVLRDDLGVQNGHSCSSPANTPSWPLLGPVQAWADAGWTGVTLALANTNESDSTYWRKFSVAQTFLIISYNSLPTVDTLVTAGTSQVAACGGTELVLNATGGLRLAATVRDPDAGSAVTAHFEYQDITAGTAVVALPPTAAVAPPHTFEVELPPASVPDGHRIRWQVRGSDGIDTGPESGWCQVLISNSAPGQPTVTAPDLPPFPAAPPASTTVGAAVRVVLSPAPGDTDVVGYFYGVGSVEPAATTYAPAELNGTATVHVVPVTSGLSKNFLTVVAVDVAGNRSPIPPSAPDAPGTRQFRANPGAAAAPERGDATGDGRADLTMPIDMGGGNNALWQWTGLTGGPAGALAAPIAPQGPGTVYPAAAQMVAGDFDGDGLSDMAVAEQRPEGVRLTVQRSVRNGLFGAPAQTLTGWNLSQLRLVAGNFDGDAAGRDDLAAMYNNANLAFSWRMLLANGSPGTPTFAAPVTWYTSGNNTHEWARMRPFAGDMDGDGRVDVGYLYRYDSCLTRAWVNYSSGQAIAAGVVAWDSGVNNWCNDRATDPLTGDFDADGRTDIAMFYHYDNCRVLLWSFYGEANRTLVLDGGQWESGTGNWCPDRARLTAEDRNDDGRTDITAVYRCCGGNQISVRTFTANPAGRGLAAPQTLWEGRVGPIGTPTNPNLLLGAGGTASSSAPDSWGWSLRAATDGVVGGVGWSSWSNVEVPHTEWIELTMPASRTINRVDLYPRGDAPWAGENFPANFTIEIWTGTGWEVMVTRTNYPRLTSGSGQTFTFAARTTNRVRIVGTGQGIIQFAELEAYQQ